jgi:hypothetical protein
MFERYTEKARRTIFFAKYEAAHFGSPCIETEHLLLGLLREDLRLFRRLQLNVDYESIHQEVTKHTHIEKPKAATYGDLPLSDESKRALRYGAEEADRLGHKHIDTQHLLLGLLREKKHPAALLLLERGADLEKLRPAVDKEPAFGTEVVEGRWWERDDLSPGRRFRLATRERVEIHGSGWDADYVREAIGRCREYSWHWHKRAWTARDVVIERQSGRVSFDLALAEDAANFELVKAGWKKDHCVCGWELYDAKDDPTHGTGYTNGRDWLCTECYEKFLARPDFFSSNYPEMT